MERSRIATAEHLMWLALLMGLLGLGLVAKPPCWAAAWSSKACIGTYQGPGPAPRSGAEVHEAADPWAISPTGTRLGPGFGLGEARPALLP